MKREDNERLVRVGAGTPMGEVFRRYWQPALLAWEIAEPDCPPVRVRLLGEDLVAFRDTDGRVGLVDAYCPHRRAPMFFGRNEACGLRCVYHGWKFDVDGNCLELPSEPADSPTREKVKMKAYPTHEKGGVIWAYMGPRETMPPPPDYEWMRAPETHRHVSKTFQDCNYLQAMEGGLDTSHSSWLHNLDLKGGSMIRARDGAPQIEVHPTDYGYYYVSRRNLGESGEYVRVYQYIMPVQQFRGDVVSMTGGRNEVPKIEGHFWVPIDDERTFTWNWTMGFDDDAELTPEFVESWEAFVGRGKDDLIPGTFQLKRNLSNDYLIDREKQKHETFTGIEGVNTQDIAVQEGMGPIVDRSEEFLCQSDKAIVAMRRMLLKATRAVADGGSPPGVDPQTHRSVRAYDCIVPRGVDWTEHMAEHLAAKW
jgi:phenylpropionate dioxygenase-like ring-hydroxylating dioxygenase large terminal subunit